MAPRMCNPMETAVMSVWSGSQQDAKGISNAGEIEEVMLERWHQNPGSCSRWSKNELHEHAGSKQEKFLLKESR